MNPHEITIFNPSTSWRNLVHHIAIPTRISRISQPSLVEAVCAAPEMLQESVKRFLEPMDGGEMGAR